MKKLIDLKENLIPFIAEKTPSTVIWKNKSLPLDSEAIKSSTSYLISESEKISIFTGRELSHNEKIFYAERYGGGAISYNGGGSRCGFDGTWQVKGIGANPLLGQGSVHIDGELTLTEAIREVLWGSVMEKLLPFGAVPTIALLLTDKYPDGRVNPGVLSFPLALLVRKPAIRPAHFCRAPYYRCHESMRSQKHDAERIENVIGEVINCLPQPIEITENQWLNMPKDEKAICGLAELSKRLATQIAFCQSRHLSIMSSPSNCDMEGRFLDFHGVTNIFPTERQEPGSSFVQLARSNEDPPLLLQGLLDICFYLYKYKFDSIFLFSAQKTISETFNYNYNKTYWIESLCIAGFEREFLHSIYSNPDYASIGTDCQKIINMSPGIFSLKLGICQAGEHPAIPMLYNLIEESGSLINNSSQNKKMVKTHSNSASEKFKYLCHDYFNYKSSSSESIKDVIGKMKLELSRRLQARKFMERKSIQHEILELGKNINEISKNIEEYESQFVKKTLNILK